MTKHRHVIQDARSSAQSQLTLPISVPLRQPRAHGTNNTVNHATGSPRAAEFFAGIGLLRRGLESAGIDVVFANDISDIKYRIYSENFSEIDFRLGDIGQLTSADIPDIEIATASFPCTDLSLAGNRAGIRGTESGTFWEFTRLLKEMDERRPGVILLENVGGLGSSGKGEDLREAITELNRLGYWCDILAVDAAHFLPQSRPRLFIVGSRRELVGKSEAKKSKLRPGWLVGFANQNEDLDLQFLDLQLPEEEPPTLGNLVERLDPQSERWWDMERTERFEASLSPLQLARLEGLKSFARKQWATAYRRTRNGVAVWEIRADEISGCLRTARGGSSKQAVVEAGQGSYRVRWMTALEYARLQGAPDFRFSSVSEIQAMTGFGDAVCVPVVEWLATAYLKPLAQGTLTSNESRMLSH